MSRLDFCFKNITEDKYYSIGVHTIPCHTRLSRDACCDDNNVGPLKCFLQSITLGQVAKDLSPRVNVVQICRNARRMNDIIERNFVKQITL